VNNRKTNVDNNIAKEERSGQSDPLRIGGKKMAVIEVNKSNFNTEVTESSVPVLVDFWADWCGPCRMLSPLVEQVAEENKEVKVCKINVDTENSLAAEYKIMSIPTLLVFQEGKEVKRSVGAISKNEIEALLKL
jgi:thioredoxin 1